MMHSAGFEHLAKFPEFTSEIKPYLLIPEFKEKLTSTVKYSLKQDSEQDMIYVVKRCAIALIAEFEVAKHMNGLVNFGSENLDDPYSYAYDVLASPEFSGLRIEVKTHQSASKYISASIDNSSRLGINLSPFLNLHVCDAIIVFKVTESDNKFLFTPVIISDKIAIQNSEVLKKSKYSGYYFSPVNKSGFNLINKLTVN